jgi:hypothetical protein
MGLDGDGGGGVETKKEIKKGGGDWSISFGLLCRFYFGKGEGIEPHQFGHGS